MKIAIVLVLFTFVFGLMAQADKTLLDYYPQTSAEDWFKITSTQFTEQKRVFTAPHFKMDCPVLPPPAPTSSIYQLKPGHIKVVMAMGDSITAGMSAKDKSVLSLKEYRGLSYCIGADAGVATLPNILRSVTGQLPVGCSTGIGTRTSAGTGLNAAESGDINSDMLTQAQWLVSKMKGMSSINMAEDWKVVTIWIGSNNLCDLCNNQDRNVAADFEKNLYAALDYLRANVPRLFVNLLPNLDVTQISGFKNGSCSFVHAIACACGTSSDIITRETVRKETMNYHLSAFAIAAHYAAFKDEGFAVVTQPFLTELYIQERIYLSEADCFHPSAIAHELAAVALWNNMLSPQVDKKTSWEIGGEPLCPNADTLIYTD